MRHGFLLIDKPIGPSSHDAVAQVRAVLKEQKIGHLGTLDPAAEGLLVLAVGAKALKVVELFSDLPKEYRAHIHFGATSTTYDREGVIERWSPVAGWHAPDEITIRSIIGSRFLGKIQQVPPAHSAVKIGGERAYRKARQGRGVNIPPREVEITECIIERYAYPHLHLKVACGSGTYIRSLAHDLGQVLQCGGYLEGLKRISVGEWSVEDAIKPGMAMWTKVIPLKDVLAAFPKLELTDAQAEDIKHGRSIAHETAPDTIGWNEGLPIAVLIPCRDGTRQSRARKVL
ncbi:MAG TPA: tRNA pseudouridine(55) synthase TruB [Candidatus Peribacter riflensis]|uniref:tRNA pseudouridine synthase B n=1 Tax=Candidatus Peribacter riflensis TaxID=1735162 RepID=A0A0S1SJX8_9BACT|nr:MAG: tRNA pseudouridine55 synthase [Candidatus Peribacter riflensis]OGJ79105.1 MAG: tRNA pseudouridine(55) synthase TruB [Candidatus Peribacteria bacterium RIFOXYB1_FULL_57_12]OGJ80419.1 MAG: tRNA pseudouridine(55) synthase TruB [Candidatus Peribacteria bacterium RIFOXYC1_FULL_58_8]ALM11068.1 MAG: tRNA pseudouridine synthase B [Candidatus Peribacter riflensis]ALM12171.1 MAG: tRNA pseudouridine synthase B [Candidatus Peribacter riflensis]